MSEPLIPMTPVDGVDEAPDGGRRKQLMILGGVAGVALLGAGAFALMSGGSSGDSQAFVPPVHHVVAAAPSAGPTPSTKPQSVLQTYHGSVGDRDPFAIPAAVIAAQNPPKAAAAAAPAGSATPAPAASQAPGTIVVPGTAAGGLPTSLTTGTGTTISIPAGTSTTVTVAPSPDQYLQLLAAHDTASGWVVDVRSAKGVAKGVKPGTKDVDGTLFYYQGEDETTGKPTFVFTVGESQGGNLLPNAKESPKKPHADKGTLILHAGVVDGGVYAE